MEFITTPYTIEDITKLHEVADALVIATPFFSVRGAAYFDVEELGLIRKLSAEKSMNMYVLVNRFFMEDELKLLREHLAYLKELDVDGIYYGDEGVLYEAKKLHMEHKLIYNPDTLITNKEDVQYYLDEGISMVTISKEITLHEICEIARNVKGNCEVIIHGRLNMMHSKRHLLSNYLDFLGKSEDIKDKHDLYIMEETRDEHMPIIEDDLGTHVFTGFTLSSFDEIKDLSEAGIQHVRIDGIFHDIDYVCEMIGYYKEILNGTRNGRKTYEEMREKYPEDHMTHGFYYTKTSKVK
ncbi:MAG: U32 family peptidase [Longicatena sp.]